MSAHSRASERHRKLRLSPVSTRESSRLAASAKRIASPASIRSNRSKRSKMLSSTRSGFKTDVFDRKASTRLIVLSLYLFVLRRATYGASSRTQMSDGSTPNREGSRSMRRQAANLNRMSLSARTTTYSTRDYRKTRKAEEQTRSVRKRLILILDPDLCSQTPSGGGGNRHSLSATDPTSGSLRPLPELERVH
jgi:hypothetical protein